ncbi:MAG: enoyl-CoA hydratase/isomerase family protein [Myxococcales bacterium]|nr:enoyl-CoA hydratase/isomerase family protein [Myxococcales bacterium]
MSDLYIDQDGGALRITFARPEVHNAFTGAMLQQIGNALDEARTGGHVRVVVLAAEGKSFCAGADLRWMASQAGGDHSAVLGRFFETLNRYPMPTIARIQGPVRGGGVGIISCCDIPLCTRAASFALTEVRLGLAPAVISPYVVRKIGVAAARELFVTGETFDADRAQRLQLVNHVFNSEREMDRAITRLTSSVIKGGPVAVAECKNLALTMGEVPTDEALTTTTALIARLRAGEEGQEGMRSFLEKRAASWVLEAEGGDER